MANCIEPTLANFRLLFPEFAAVDDTTIQFYLDLSLCKLEETIWKNCYGEAVLYITAHEVALSQNRQSSIDTSNNNTSTSSSGGAISSASAGAISASFAVSKVVAEGAASYAYYGLTQYGQKYLALMSECLPRGILASCNTVNFSGTIS